MVCANIASQSSTSPTVPPLVPPPSSGESSNKRIANSRRTAFLVPDRLSPSTAIRIYRSEQSPECAVKTNRNSLSMTTVPSQLDSLPSVSLVSEHGWQGKETRAGFLFLFNCVHMVFQGREETKGRIIDRFSLPCMYR